MTVIACGHRILVKPERLEDIDPALKRAREWGLQLAESPKRQEQAAVDKGTVLQIGPTAFKDFGGEAWCAVGDLVAYAKYGGKYVTDPYTQEEVLILNDEDIVAVLKKD